jgi:hypothetical protein
VKSVKGNNCTKAILFARAIALDEWWAQQEGLRQTLRTEVAVGQKGPNAQLDQWTIIIRYEGENPG